MTNKVYTCPEEFIEFISQVSLPELLIVIADLKKYPEDAEFLNGAEIEMQKRITQMKGR